MRYASTLTADGSGIIALGTSIGGVFTVLGDFTDFATCFNRFNIVSAKVNIIPSINSAVTLLKTPLAVSYINDGAVGTPSSVLLTLALEQSMYVNPLCSAPNGASLSCNPKPTLDPWSPTNGATAAQKLQFGGFQFYSASNLISIVHWYYVIEAVIVFTDKN
jgi:hypothetical protein